MDYREHLLRPMSLRFADKLAQEIFINPSDMDIVYRLIFDPEIKVAWRAAWVCQKISEKYPEWYSDSQFNELSAFALTTRHGGLQRGCLSILNNLPVPVNISVDFINTCFEWMVSLKSPIAVQALSMKMLYRICLIEPDFKHELIAYLENIDSGAYSAGFNSTRRNVLKLLTTK